MYTFKYMHIYIYIQTHFFSCAGLLSPPNFTRAAALMICLIPMTPFAQRHRQKHDHRFFLVQKVWMFLVQQALRDTWSPARQEYTCSCSSAPQVMQEPFERKGRVHIKVKEMHGVFQRQGRVRMGHMKGMECGITKARHCKGNGITIIRALHRQGIAKASFEARCT